MNLLTIAAIGAGIYFLSQSKNSTASNKKTENDDKKSEGGIVFVPPAGGIPVPKPGTTKPKIPQNLGLAMEGCSQNQYKSNGECITFWDENTEGLVLDKIREKAQIFINKQNPKPTGIIGKDYITPLCLDNPPDENGVQTSNTNAINIIKSTIIDLWPVVKAADFPVTQKSPSWLITVWNRVIDIYYKEICQL